MDIENAELDANFSVFFFLFLGKFEFEFNNFLFNRNKVSHNSAV